MVSMRTFSTLCSKIRSRNTVSSRTRFHVFFFSVDNRRVYKIVCAKNVTRKKVFLILCLKKNKLISLLKACCFGTSKSPVIPFLMCRVMSMGLPHHALNRPTPATFQNNFAVIITNGTSHESSFHIVL